MRMHRAATAATLTLLIFTACDDPEKAVNSYFEKLGLTRVATIRDDIEPGGLILVQGSKAFYADNMLDYIDGAGAAEFSLVAQSGSAEYNAVLKKYETDRSLEPSLALGFVEKILPISLSADVKLSSKVTIDLIDAKVKRIKVPTIQNFLGSNGSKGFREAVWKYSNGSEKMESFLIYETWRAKKLKISSESGKDVTTSLEVGEVKDLLSKAEGKINIKRTSKTDLEIDGDRFYVFAVRTGQLVRGAQQDAVSLKNTEFAKPAGWGIMSVGTDDKYSAAPTGSFSIPLTLEPSAGF